MEVDFALETLVQYSYTDAPLIPLEALPGLPAALLDVVRPTNLTDGETTRRRLEAALVLRNLIVEGGERAVAGMRSVASQILQVLVLVLEDKQELSELRLYMLETAEPFAPRYKLQLPSSSNPTEERTPEQKLYPLLAKVAQSNDRALLIATYTLLGGLAMNDHNEAVFASVNNRSLSTPSTSTTPFNWCPTTSLLQRAIQLLPLGDFDLLLPILEFLYQNTLIPSNGSIVVARPDLRDILRIVTNRISEGGREETIEYEILTQPGLQNARGRAVRDSLIATYPSLAPSSQERVAQPPPEAKLEGPGLERVLRMPEPQRVKEWMQTVLEAHPGGEITQVNLWKAYQKQFEPFDEQMKNGLVPPMLTASDVIKSSSEAFPHAQPKVIEDEAGKRFVISGIRIRPNEPPLDPAEQRLRDRWRCQWAGCADATQHERGEGLYLHLQQAHVQRDSPSQACQFGPCSHQSTSLQDLLLHLRVHILPSGPTIPSAPNKMVYAADDLDRANTYFEEKTIRSQTVLNEYAAGIGFVATLVLRNCARAVASAAQRYKKSVGNSMPRADVHMSDANGESRGNGASHHGEDYEEEDDFERRRVFGFLSGKGVQQVDEDAMQNDGARELSLTRVQMESAVSAVVPLESDVLALAASSRELGAYLIETLECIVTAKKTVEGIL